MKKRMPQTTHAISGLYAITPDCADTHSLLDRVRRALAGGARVVQYRNKVADAALRRAQAEALRDLTRQFSVPLIVNDDAVLAAGVGADGVHLGGADGGVAEARAQLGEGKIIGVSCYNRASLAFAAAAAGADYVAFGAFYPSSVKPGAAKAEVGMLREARARLPLPVVAIGGITPQNGAALIEAGADALAVISGVFGADDIEAAAREFTALFRQTTT